MKPSLYLFRWKTHAENDWCTYEIIAKTEAEAIDKIAECRGIRRCQAAKAVRCLSRSVSQIQGPTANEYMKKMDKLVRQAFSRMQKQMREMDAQRVLKNCDILGLYK